MTDASSLAARIARSNAYYARFREEQAARSEARDDSRALDAFCALIPPGGAILDIGCGSGGHTEEFVRRGYRVVGVEPSPEMRAACLARGLDVMDGSWETLYDIHPPLSDGVWCAASLLHVPRDDVPGALHDLGHCVRPDGAVYITVRLGDGASWDEREGEQRFIQLFDADDLVDLLRRAGFDIRERWTEESTWGRPATWLQIIATQQVFTADDVRDVLGALSGIDVWLDGGWGVDALLGEQTRKHADLDLMCRIEDVPALCDALPGFDVVEGDLHTNFVLCDANGRRVDMHPVRFEPDGSAVYKTEEGGEWVLAAEEFTGRGTVGGLDVQCLSVESQVRNHTQGYVMDELDHQDLRALEERFDVAIPSRHQPS